MAAGSTAGDAAAGAVNSIAGSGLDQGTKIGLISLVVFLLAIALVLIVKRRGDKKGAADDAEAEKALAAATMTQPLAPGPRPPRPPRTQRESVVQWCNRRPPRRDGWEAGDAMPPTGTLPRGTRRPLRLRVHAVEEDEQALTAAVDGVSPPRSPYLPPPRSPYGDAAPLAPRSPMLAPPRSPFDDRAALPSPRSPYVPPPRSPYDVIRSPRGPPRPPRPRESQIDLPPWEPSVYPQLSSREGS